ncbi:MAG: MaoC family dehydratase N-terminal domain-containing protein [Anaerolineales bacterium]|nr:MaoC family dehydratase N-terminal domain-containing protein [Anaerolineales bacterium]
MTETQDYQPRGLYFEEFEIGKTVVTTSRTVTESHIISFAALSGDYNQIHTDVEFAQSTPFGQRIAHGLLVLSMASGLIAQLGLIEGTVIAFRELNWKFTKPVFIDDTIRVTAEVVRLKPLSRLNGGVVILKVAVLNQRDEVTARGEWHALMASKPD